MCGLFINKNSLLNCAVICLFALILFSCSEREYLNPLDPDNPDTHGAPENVRVYSNRQTATLTWSPFRLPSMEKYYIYKSVNEPNLVLYDSVNANSTRYMDSGLLYDQKYYYAVQAITKFDKSKISKSVATIPGRFNFILADYYGQSLIKLTYDGNSTLQFINSNPTDVEVLDGTVFYTNLWTNTLAILDNEGNIETIQIDGAPIAMTSDKASNRLFILTRDNDRLLTLSSNGQLLDIRQMPYNVLFETNVAFDKSGPGLWMTSKDDDTIYYYDLRTNRFQTVSSTIDGPDEIIIDPDTGGWIASWDGLIFVNIGTAPVRYLSDYRFYDLSLNPLSNHLYYTAYANTDKEWLIGRFHIQSYENEILFREHYNFMTKIKAIPKDNGAGLLLVQGNTGKVFRIDENGNEIGLYEGTYGIVDIELQ